MPVRRERPKRFTCLLHRWTVSSVYRGLIGRAGRGCPRLPSPAQRHALPYGWRPCAYAGVYRCVPPRAFTHAPTTTSFRWTTACLYRAPTCAVRRTDAHNASAALRGLFTSTRGRLVSVSVLIPSCARNICCGSAHAPWLRLSHMRHGVARRWHGHSRQFIPLSWFSATTSVSITILPAMRLRRAAGVVPCTLLTPITRASPRCTILPHRHCWLPVVVCLLYHMSCLFRLRWDDSVRRIAFVAARGGRYAVPVLRIVPFVAVPCRGNARCCFPREGSGLPNLRALRHCHPTHSLPTPILFVPPKFLFGVADGFCSVLTVRLACLTGCVAGRMVCRTVGI